MKRNSDVCVIIAGPGVLRGVRARWSKPLIRLNCYECGTVEAGIRIIKQLGARYAWIENINQRASVL